MKVIRPSNNKITGGYTATHPAYDFAGLNLPDEILAGQDGIVIQSVNLYTNSWINTGKLTTRDYGNFIMIKHTDGTYELHAHLKKDSMFNVGAHVKAGKLIARIGNTGNSSGAHVHSEYRDANNKNIEVEFLNELPVSNQPMPIQSEMDKITQHDSTLKTAQDVLDKFTFKDGVISLKDSQIGQLQRNNADLQNVINGLTDNNKALTDLLAECELKCQQATDNKYNNLVQSIAEICKKILSLQFIADVREQLRKKDV